MCVCVSVCGGVETIKAEEEQAQVRAVCVWARGHVRMCGGRRDDQGGGGAGAGAWARRAHLRTCGGGVRARACAHDCRASPAAPAAAAAQHSPPCPLPCLQVDESFKAVYKMSKMYRDDLVVAKVGGGWGVCVGRGGLVAKVGARGGDGCTGAA